MKSLIPWRGGRKHAAPARLGEWSDSWWDDPFGSLLPSMSGAFTSRLPAVDVSDNGKEVKVRAEIPGMNEKDLDLSWHDGVLRLRGEKKAEKEEKKGNHFYRECSYGSFSRDIDVGRNVDWKKATARYKHGVLTVTLPRTENAQKAIEIKVT